MRNALHNLYKRTVESVTAPLAKSQFDEKRVLTPEEFVASGDFLVRACPTWSWEGGDVKKRRSYFPADKQYLVTRNVPCLKRASDVEGSYNPNYEVPLQGEDDWVATHQDPTHPSSQAVPDIPNIDDDTGPGAGAAGASTSATGGGGCKATEDDLPDLDALELQEDDDVAVPSRPAAGASSSSGAAGRGSGIMRTRTYDLYITYDQYYQVPRLWLVGYDEGRQPLASQQILEDVSEEHARKTITVEPHPHMTLTAASIHPCRHAETMKRLVDNMLESGGSFSVEHYLVLFLKFIASVVPTIQYDYTMSVGQ